MPDMPPPSLADDEATLRSYAERLAAAVSEVTAHWMTRLVEERQAGLAATPEAQDVIAQGVTEVSAELHDLLRQDIADQARGPLEVLRSGVRFPAQILAAADVAPVPRDDFAQRNFPTDHYNLTPASFADVDPTLHEPGLMWGAAKAHVHLRRRREA